MAERTVVGYVNRVEHGQHFQSPMLVCPGYGIICTALGNTNGYLIQVAINMKALFCSVYKARRESGDPLLTFTFLLEGEIIDVPNMTKEALYLRLREVYKKYGD